MAKPAGFGQSFDFDGCNAGLANGHDLDNLLLFVVAMQAWPIGKTLRISDFGGYDAGLANGQDLDNLMILVVATQAGPMGMSWAIFSFWWLRYKPVQWARLGQSSGTCGCNQWVLDNLLILLAAMQAWPSGKTWTMF